MLLFWKKFLPQKNKIIPEEQNRNGDAFKTKLWAYVLFFHILLRERESLLGDKSVTVNITTDNYNSPE